MSLISTDPAQARKIAREALYALRVKDNRKEIIDLFKVNIPEEKICAECGTKKEWSFSEWSLEYSIHDCNVCEQKRKETSAKELEIEKEQKYKEFKDILPLIINEELTNCNVPSLFINSNLSKIDLQIKKNLKPDANYYICGNIGTGKTYIATAILRQYIENMEPVYNSKCYLFNIRQYPIFISVPDLLLKIRDSFKTNSTYSEMEIVNEYANTPFLILDDMGVEKTSEWSLQTLYIIINRRYSENRTTIITSNLKLDEIANKLNDRIASRIIGMCEILELKGKDRRL